MPDRRGVDLRTHSLEKQVDIKAKTRDDEKAAENEDDETRDQLGWHPRPKLTAGRGGKEFLARAARSSIYRQLIL